MKRTSTLLLLLVVALSVGACRGQRSDQAPFHLNPNFDFQSKFKAQKLSWDTPEGAVAWGDRTSFSHPERRKDFLKEDSVFYLGRNADGSFVQKIPMPVDEAFIKHGQERFDIYCSVCHDKSGSGKGMVPKRGFTPPPHLADERIRAMSDGEIFTIISDGVRTMPSYSKQISEEDRWAVVAYVRALQTMWHSTETDVPLEMRDRIE